MNLCNEEVASVAAGCLKSRAGLDFSPALAPQGEKEKENPEKGENPVTVTVRFSTGSLNIRRIKNKNKVASSAGYVLIIIVI